MRTQRWQTSELHPSTTMTSKRPDYGDTVKEFGRPPPIDFYEDQELLWPAWKFGMKPEDMYLGLHDQYNTLRIPIQCQRLFHLDIKELANKASTSEEFHQLMAQRSRDRFREVDEALYDIDLDLLMSVDKFPDNDLFSQFFAFVRSKCASGLATFLAGFQKSLKESPMATDGHPRALLTGPYPPIPDSPFLSDLSPLSQKRIRKARPQRRTANEIVRYNLRPRASGTSQRKERKRKPPSKKRP
jgi:hypothetical protein